MRRGMDDRVTPRDTIGQHASERPDGEAYERGRDRSEQVEIVCGHRGSLSMVESVVRRKRSNPAGAGPRRGQERPFGDSSERGGPCYANVLRVAYNLNKIERCGRASDRGSWEGARMGRGEEGTGCGITTQLVGTRPRSA